MKPEEAVRATLSSLPDEVVDTVGVTSLPSEDSVSERRRKLDFLEMQEELIKVADIYLYFPQIRVWSKIVLYLVFDIFCLTYNRRRKRKKKKNWPEKKNPLVLKLMWP